MLHDLNQSLVGTLDVKLRRISTAKESLEMKVSQLSEQLEDLRKAASQREMELLGSADQCKAVLEDQVSSLHKQVASLEHDLYSTKEDLREVQQQLRRKEEELLELTKTISGEQSTANKLTSDLEEASAAMEALRGQHQLESAQLTIKARELTQQLEAAIRAKEELVVSHLAILDRAKEEHQAVVQEFIKREKEQKDELEKLTKKHGKDIEKRKAVESSLKEKTKELQKLKKDFNVFTRENSKLQEKVASLENELAMAKMVKEEEHIYEEPPEELSVVSTSTV